MTQPELGHYLGMPWDQYRMARGMSASGAKAILRSPAHYRLQCDEPSEPTPQMQFGTAVHCGVLEPEHFAKRVILAPKIDGRTTEGKLAKQQFERDAIGKIALKQDDFDRARRCVDAVLAHPVASKLLSGGQAERSFFFRDQQFDVPCKARFDYSARGGIVDLKTCIDASPEGFSKAIGNFLYHLQAWAYYSAHEHILNCSPQFFAFVCVETEAPHAVACYWMGRASLQTGARLWDEALARYAKALKDGKWEGYPPTIEMIEAPRWALRFDV